MRVPETAGVSLEDIDRLFTSEAGREDAELRREVRCFSILNFVLNMRVLRFRFRSLSSSLALLNYFVSFSHLHLINLT